jgi:hypothetical protein
MTRPALGKGACDEDAIKGVKLGDNAGAQIGAIDEGGLGKIVKTVERKP